MTINLPHNHGDETAIEKIEDILEDSKSFEDIANVFKQLGDATRIKIFWLLCHSELCVVNISALMNMTSPAVSHHLRYLKNSDLIESRREGKEVYYKVSSNSKAIILHKMIEMVMDVECPKQS